MNPSDDTPPNPILETILAMMDSIAHGGLDDPEKAMRDLVPRLRHLVIEKVEKPTVSQLEAIRVLKLGSSLTQIRKELQVGELRFGPFPGDLVEQALVPKLVDVGLKVSLRQLSDAEKAQYSGVDEEGALTKSICMNVVFENDEQCACAAEEAVAEFERDHGFNLPPVYRQFLLSCGGGSPNPDWSAFGRDGDYVAYVFGIHCGAEWKRLSNAVKEFEQNLSTFLPVAVSAGGNYFLLRLQEPDLGAIYFWDHELERSHPPTFESLIRVSDSFSSWLCSLQQGP